MAIEPQCDCQPGAPEWVVTFGDMMSLLLTFFILLLSFTTTDMQKFQRLAGTIQDGFGVPQERLIVPVQSAHSVLSVSGLRVEYNARRLLQKLRRDLDPYRRARQRGKVDLRISSTFRGVSVLMPVEALFEPGTDRLGQRSGALLGYIAGTARAQPDLLLEIEVFSPAGAPLGRFEDPWALTTAQAVALLGWMKGAGGLPPHRLRVVGRGGASLPEGPPEAAGVRFLFLSDLRQPGGKA